MLFDASVAYASVEFSLDELTRFGDPSALPPALARAVPKRRLEFLAGRHCAREALSRLSPAFTDAPVGIGERGAPVWPAGVLGSITHTHGFAAAAVVRACDALGIGLDTERRISSARAGGIASQIANPSELDRLSASGVDPETLLTVVFSAKESLFKCLYPRVGRYFDFLDATVVRVDPRARGFTIALEVDLGGLARGARLEGRLAVEGDLVHTGLVLRSLPHDLVGPAD